MVFLVEESIISNKYDPFFDIMAISLLSHVGCQKQRNILVSTSVSHQHIDPISDPRIACTPSYSWRMSRSFCVPLFPLMTKYHYHITHSNQIRQRGGLHFSQLTVYPTNFTRCISSSGLNGSPHIVSNQFHTQLIDSQITHVELINFWNRLPFLHYSINGTFFPVIWFNNLCLGSITLIHSINHSLLITNATWWCGNESLQ